MKYFIFTYAGDGLPVAYKLQQEGHEVTVGQVEEKQDVHAKSEGRVKPELPLAKERRLGLFNNMLKKVPAWELIEQIKQIKNPEGYFIFFDRNNLFTFANEVKDLGFKGNFPTEEDYLFEQDRDGAKDFVKKYYPQLHVATVKEFTKIDDAIKFLVGTEDIWVLKGKDDSAKTFIPDVTDPELAARQIAQALDASKKAYEQNGFILELMISPVIELTPEKIYYDGEPIALTLDIENKPFGSGNTSIQTGCAQDLVFPLSFEDRIHQIAFPPIVDEIAKKRKGLFYWDASLLIDKRTGKIYFGEFCSNRPGYNSLLSEISQCPSVNHYFESISQKKNPFSLGTVAASVTMFDPDTDEGSGLPPKDSPVEFKENIAKDLWLWSVYKKGDRIVSSGDDWSIAIITGSGKSIEEAVHSVYKNIDDFSFVGSYNRPQFDYVSLGYPTSILNRLNYGVERGLYHLPFKVKVGEIEVDK